MNNISWPVVKHHFRQEPSRAGWAAHPASAEPRFGARALKAGVSFPACNYRAGNKISENGVSFWGQVWTSRGPGTQRGMPSGLVGLQLPGAVLGVLQPGLSHRSHNPTPRPDFPKHQRSLLLPSAALARCSLHNYK